MDHSLCTTVPLRCVAVSGDAYLAISVPFSVSSRRRGGHHGRLDIHMLLLEIVSAHWVPNQLTLNRVTFWHPNPTARLSDGLGTHWVR